MMDEGVSVSLTHLFYPSKAKKLSTPNKASV